MTFDAVIESHKKRIDDEVDRIAFYARKSRQNEIRFNYDFLRDDIYLRGNSILNKFDDDERLFNGSLSMFKLLSKRYVDSVKVVNIREFPYNALYLLSDDSRAEFTDIGFTLKENSELAEATELVFKGICESDFDLFYLTKRGRKIIEDYRGELGIGDIGAINRHKELDYFVDDLYRHQLSLAGKR